LVFVYTLILLIINNVSDDWKVYMKNEKDLFSEPGHELADKSEDPFMGFLHKIIRIAVKVLAVLMVAVIVWGIGDVIYVLYQRLMAPPFLLLSISDILATFGAFLAVINCYRNFYKYYALS